MRTGLFAAAALLLTPAAAHAQDQNLEKDEPELAAPALCDAIGSLQKADYHKNIADICGSDLPAPDEPQSTIQPIPDYVMTDPHLPYFQKAQDKGYTLVPAPGLKGFSGFLPDRLMVYCDGQSPVGIQGIFRDSVRETPPFSAGVAWSFSPVTQDYASVPYAIPSSDGTQSPLADPDRMARFTAASEDMLDYAGGVCHRTHKPETSGAAPVTTTGFYNLNRSRALTPSPGPA